MTGLKYDSITRYKITACCEGPLHIGSAIGGKEEVLIDPVSRVPFVQASSIAGVFRGYCKDYLKDARCNSLFGEANVDNMSRLRFEDGFFNDKCKLEYRPHVGINSATGSVSSAKIKGTDSKSGQKFNMEYVGAGSEIEFDMYLYEDSDSSDELYELTGQILAAMKMGYLQFGGKKSDGSGIIKLVSVKSKKYDMKNDSDRKAWMESDDNDLKETIDDLKSADNRRFAYEITIKGTTENSIQIKGLEITKTADGTPDSQSIQNALKEYIVPGSSFKGVMRAQMEKIAGFLGCSDIIETSFGKAAASGKTGEPGNLLFYDAIIGDRESIDRMPIEHRIHIDKFTGGVMDKSLFSEKNAAGDIKLEIKIVDRNDVDRTLGLLIYALRDLAIGTMSIGGGYSVGKGMINVSEIAFTSLKDNAKARLLYKSGTGTVEDPNGILQKAINSLKGECR